MRAGLSVLALTLVLMSQNGEAQLAPYVPGAALHTGKSSDRNYGPPRFVEIESLDFMDGHEGSHILTEGEISLLQAGRFWTVGKLGISILLIPGNEFDASELDRALGRRVQVRGVARKIRPKEYVSMPDGTLKDRDLFDHPTLPVMPAPSQSLPRLSITVFALQDRSYDGSFKREGLGGGVGRRIIDDPSSYSGKKARIYGQFRGRNLFADLPEGSARTPDDWVLKDGDAAMWVTGKAPKGKGWSLDLALKGDSKHWLEVEGKPEVVNGIVYLKASQVTKAKAPSDDKDEAPRR